MKNIEKIGTKIVITETNEVESSDFIKDLETKLDMVERQIEMHTTELQSLKEEKQSIKQQIKDLE